MCSPLTDAHARRAVATAQLLTHHASMLAFTCPCTCCLAAPGSTTSTSTAGSRFGRSLGRNRFRGVSDWAVCHRGFGPWGNVRLHSGCEVLLIGVHQWVLALSAMLSGEVVQVNGPEHDTTEGISSSPRYRSCKSNSSGCRILPSPFLYSHMGLLLRCFPPR